MSPIGNVGLRRARRRPAQVLKFDSGQLRAARQRVASARTRVMYRSAPTVPASMSRASSRRRCPARARPRSHRPMPAGGEVVVVDAGTMSCRHARSCCATATSPTSRTRAAAFPTTSAQRRSRPTARKPGCHPSRTTSSAAHCATAPALNFQNTVRAISSRIVLATGREDHGSANRPRQRERRQRRCIRPARGVPVRRAGDESRGCSDRRSRRLPGHALRRRPGAAGTRTVGGWQDAVRQQLHGSHGRCVRPAAAARAGRSQRAAARRLERRGVPRSWRPTCCWASSTSTMHATRAWRGTAI